MPQSGLSVLETHFHAAIPRAKLRQIASAT